jgi:hypothetical protein
MTNGIKSLTAAAYHLRYGYDYLLDFKRESYGHGKRQADNWATRSQVLLRDIFDALTPESKEIFERELLKGDVLFYSAITEKLMQMNEHQREKMEYLADEILKGEDVTIEYINSKTG